MKRLVTLAAFLSSLAAAIIVVGGGVALLAIENSGERGAGALLAFGGMTACAATMALVFAKESAFGQGVWRAVAIAAGIIGAVPAAVIAFMAIRFAGLPFSSRVPLVDWTALVVGMLFALGVLATLALGHRRSQEGGDSRERGASPESGEPPLVVHMQQIRAAQERVDPPTRSDAFKGLQFRLDPDEDIRVTRV